VPEDAGASVLVVDDEDLVRDFVLKVVGDAGYRTLAASDALEAMAVIASDKPDLILLDVNLPDVDGLSLLERLRKTNDVPVILLTGRGDEADRIAGLKGGADDYITKPFSVGELTARIESVLRRSGRSAGTEAGGAIRYDGFELDARTREVVVRGERADLTSKEFDLLAFLAASPRQVFTRDQLLQHVWNSSSDWQDSATVTEHVRRLRRKIEEDPDAPRWIDTVRGVGYRFTP
jgi:DNA-binding response OmpR family regulator